MRKICSFVFTYSPTSFLPLYFHFLTGKSISNTKVQRFIKFSCIWDSGQCIVPKPAKKYVNTIFFWHNHTVLCAHASIHACLLLGSICAHMSLYTVGETEAFSSFEKLSVLQVCWQERKGLSILLTKHESLVINLVRTCIGLDKKGLQLLFPCYLA